MQTLEDLSPGFVRIRVDSSVDPSFNITEQNFTIAENYNQEDHVSLKDEDPENRESPEINESRTHTKSPVNAAGSVNDGEGTSEDGNYSYATDTGVVWKDQEAGPLHEFCRGDRLSI